jgi:hypothetical protein
MTIRSFGVVLLVVGELAACGPPPCDEAKAAAATAAYGAELNACVLDAQTKEQSAACRAEVEKRYAGRCLQ